MVDIVSRSQWGARSPRSRQTVSWGSRVEFTLHYSSGPTSQTPRQIQNFHMDGNGWSDIGYNLLVDEDGTAYEGRGWTVVGAHAAPRNTQGIGVCYIGRDNMTAAAKRTVIALYDEACRRAGRTLARKGHRDINSTSCPGSNNYAWWKSSGFRDVSGGGSGGGGAREYVAEDGDGLLEPYEYSDEIAELQRALGIEDDTYYGPDTIAAVRAYQKKHDLAVDGIAGPETLGHLDLDTPEDGAGGASFPAWPGVYLDQPPVKKTGACQTWQRRMRNRGWSITVDGWYGPASERVCRQFQDEKGLGVDGVVGPKTWRASWVAPIT